MTTPDELRKLADKMEVEFKNRVPGKSSAVKDIYIKDTAIDVCIISIHFDQERM